MSTKKIIIIVCIVLTVALGSIFYVNSFSNTAIKLEEKVYSAQSDIRVQEKARYDTVYNLADCVTAYDKHEADVLKSLAESMNSGGATAEDVQTQIDAVTYSYPELKSDANYQKFMDILTLTERTLVEYRSNYNACVESYLTYCRRFPNKQFLSFTGYEVKDFNRLDFDVSSDVPTNLFD